MTSFGPLQAAYRKFVKERDWEQFHNPKNLAMALSIEAAELMEIFQWLNLESSQEVMNSPRSKAQVQEEIADVFLYLLRLADVLNIDLIEASYQKLDRNAEKYPVELCRGSAQKYTEFSP